jgi:hypothetical protein
MGGYVYLITTRTINDYINGCIELFLKNNFKIILCFSIFSYICECYNNSNININNNNIDMVKDNKKTKPRSKALTGNSGYTYGRVPYKLGGLNERVVNGVHYRDRAKGVR